MLDEHHNSLGTLARRACLVLATLVAMAWLGAISSAHAAATQKRYTTPEQAVTALVNATRTGRSRELLKILGPAGAPLIYSGDPVADRQGREKFVASYEKARLIELKNDNTAILSIGEEKWPFPIPLVKQGASWRFDTSAGVEEILDRRIGRNELNAIEVCRAYVDAQRDYASSARHQDGLVEYAQHLVSSAETHDGLYWPVAAGAMESPMGPLIAHARAEGYDSWVVGGGGSPYHGYFYKILKQQGQQAPGGAHDYLVNGRMIGGFALVAFPARYGDSGVMTFMVNQDGVVYQKDLGTDTAKLARGMVSFNPEPGWNKVP